MVVIFVWMSEKRITLPRPLSVFLLQLWMQPSTCRRGNGEARPCVQWQVQPMGAVLNVANRMPKKEGVHHVPIGDSSKASSIQESLSCRKFRTGQDRGCDF